MTLPSKTIYYDVLKDPNDGSKPDSYHVRIANHQVIKMEQLLNEHLRSSQAENMLELWPAMLEAIKKEFRQGNTVTLDGLGTFIPILNANVSLRKKAYQSSVFDVADIHIGRIAFRAAKKLKTDVEQDLNYKYMPKPRGQIYKVDDCDVFFTKFFAEPYNQLTRSDVQKLTGLSSYASTCLIRQLLREGRLRPVGRGRNTRYIPTPGHFGWPDM